MNNICLFLLLSTFACQSPSSDHRFYVSTNGEDTNAGVNAAEPLKTLERAIDLAAEKSKEQPGSHFEVVMSAGRYALNKPVQLSSADFGESTIHIKAYNDEKVMISGGETVASAWNTVGANLWSTSLSVDINQLFRDEKRLIRSRWPNADQYHYPEEVHVQEQWLSLADSVRMDFEVDTNTELCTTGQWHFIRQRLAGNDTIKNIISTVTEIGPQLSSKKVDTTDRVYLENNRAFVDSEGEWYLDKDEGLLYLYTEKDPNASVFYYPVLESLLVVEGEQGKPINSVTLEGLTFQHMRWNLTDTERKGIQGGYWGTELGKPVFSSPAALKFRYAEHCTITACRFSNLGEGALAFEEGCHDNTVSNNTFDDIGSNVVQLARQSDFIGKNHPLHRDYPDSSVAPSGHTIANNHFRNVASVDRGAVAVFIGYAHHNLIKNNLIEDTPYTGISIGFRWDTVRTNTHHNEISYNHLKNCMNHLSDGGAIYTVGNQPGTLINNNYIQDTNGGEKWVIGIYNDQGSGNMAVTNNYVTNTKTYDYLAHQNLWGSNTIKDNGCESCENELVVKSKRHKFSDFNDAKPSDTDSYGVQNLSADD